MSIKNLWKNYVGRLLVVTFTFVLVFLGVLFISSSFGEAQSNSCVGDICRISPGAELLINVHGVTRRVVNPSGSKEIFVPVKTATEWQQFVVYHPSAVTVVVADPCDLPWGGTINSGESVTAYITGDCGGSSCPSQIRTCDNGTLSGSYANQSCQVSPCNDCSLPWGGTITHGESVYAYYAGSRQCGSFYRQTRVCDDGTLSGYTSYNLENSMGDCDLGEVCSNYVCQYAGCGTLVYEGESYPTIMIGDQCWMAKNLNVGTMLASHATQPNTSDQVIEKWCYNNSSVNCDAEGGLYNADEMMLGSAGVSGAQGICPTGWHIPTDADFDILENYVIDVIDSPNTQFPCDITSSYEGSYIRRCADYCPMMTGDGCGKYGAGASLKQVGMGTGPGTGDNLVGFSARLSGKVTGSGSVFLNSWGFFWSSTGNASSFYTARGFKPEHSSTIRTGYWFNYGQSVRCVAD